jgi:hypothetical protein
MSSSKIDFHKAPQIDSEAFYDLTIEEQNAIDDATGYIEEATAIDSGQSIISRFECMKWNLNTDKYCEGEIELVRYNLPPEIRWKCKKCEDRGVIVNFEETPWDLSSLSKKEAKQFLDDKYNLDLFPDFDLGPPRPFSYIGGIYGRGRGMDE